jgi:hypothetical protein
LVTVVVRWLRDDGAVVMWDQEVALPKPCGEHRTHAGRLGAGPVT